MPELHDYVKADVSLYPNIIIYSREQVFKIEKQVIEPYQK